MRGGGLILLLYVIAGVVVAAVKGYFGGLGNINEILELIVAILVWPVLLFGVDINFGAAEIGNGGGGNGGGGNQ
jgi:hypothetical protein